MSELPQAVRYVVMNWLERFFWKRLCCRPDGGRLHSWWYHYTGNIARFFHRHKGCKTCCAKPDEAETAYWRFDARRSGIGPWKGIPMSERDAFKAEYRSRK